ncbi:MAG: hypothetical protein HC838_14185, partial [Spirulinaceae cyanobacterium RM2_2_10]|nr:hypothetical protein [Spirulinaceae cyanobacterium RM2_2_10]
GYGLDGTIWGSEFLRVETTAQDWQRLAHLRPFPLPGGDRASREPRRAALGLLYTTFGLELFERPDCQAWLERVFTVSERRTLSQMLTRGLNSPLTSSLGRLFDGIAALVCGRDRASFEGQAAMQLEFAIGNLQTDAAYPLPLLPPSQPGQARQLDWQPLLIHVLNDLSNQEPVEQIAAKFHNALIDGLVAIARQLAIEHVVLTGGCFQNHYLLTRAIAQLRAAGCQPHWPQRVPINDGGIAYGQLIAALLTDPCPVQEDGNEMLIQNSQDSRIARTQNSELKTPRSGTAPSP